MRVLLVLSLLQIWFEKKNDIGRSPLDCEIHKIKLFCLIVFERISNSHVWTLMIQYNRKRISTVKERWKEHWRGFEYRAWKWIQNFNCSGLKEPYHDTFCIMGQWVYKKSKMNSLEWNWLEKMNQVFFIWPEAEWSIQDQVEDIILLYRRTELVYVAKYWEEFWIGVKGQSNSE